jgi:hypothetical protein
MDRIVLVALKDEVCIASPGMPESSWMSSGKRSTCSSRNHRSFSPPSVMRRSPGIAAEVLKRASKI